MTESRWYALAIGVAAVDNMRFLPAARRDAKRFRDWATRNKYKSSLVTDEKAPVTADRLQSVVQEIVQASPERLVIFFSGHGTSLPDGDYWLLSDFAETGAAINVFASERAARLHPIEQIAFIADACRSSVRQAARIEGRNLFLYPRLEQRRGPRIDSFYATRLGAVAQEVRDADPAKTYGVFGHLVLKAIEGREPDAFEQGREPPTVSSQSLALWLEREVPLETGRIPGAVVQWPDARPGWFRPDDWYYTRTERETDKSLVRGPAIGEGRGLQRDIGVGEQKVAAARRQRRALLNHHQHIIAESEGRASFETHEGVSVVGAEITAAAGEPGRRIDRFQENGSWHIRTEDGPQSVALKLGNTGWIALATIPGFVATVATAESRPVSVNYVPVRRTDAFDEYQAQADNAAAAEWLALLSTGDGLPDGDRALREFGDRVRQRKHSNPTLGILAAYAYDRAGAQDEVNSIAWYFAYQDGYVPFDVALLSSTKIPSPGEKGMFRWDGHAAEARIAGAFPFLTRGWALLDLEGAPGNADLAKLRPGLLPTPWTSFDLQHGDRMATLIRSGALTPARVPELAF
jgi:hypothetical protein